MSNKGNQVGFSQRIRLEWFEYVSNLVMSGKDRSAIKEDLQHLLKKEISMKSKSDRSNRDKIISILMNVWFNDNTECEELRLQGMELLKKLPNEKHVIVHWGMISAVYPFWTEVARNIGRLLKLQETVTSKQIQRRVTEQLGDRETVTRATSIVVRTYRDWGVLKDTDKWGEYCKGNIISIEDKKCVCWLFETMLHANNKGAATLRELIHSNGLFPFDLKQISAREILDYSNRLDIINQNNDTYLITIKK